MQLHSLKEKVMESSLVLSKESISTMLQVAGFMLTLAGQIQVTRKHKSAFVLWSVSNVLIVLVNIIIGMPIMALMFMVNLAFCVWSYSEWNQEERRLAPLYLAAGRDFLRG